MGRKITLLALCAFIQVATAQISTTDIDWKDFLSRHDPAWYSTPTNYYSGAIMGNGLLGLNIYADENQDIFRFNIGRSDVNEMRKGGHALYFCARLPIGHFELHTAHPIIKETDKETMHLSLYDAITSTDIMTTKGEIHLQSFVDANENIIVVEAEPTIYEKDFLWEWHPGKAISPRTEFSYTHQNAPEDYLAHPNPEPEMDKIGDIQMCIQQLYSGYTYVTAWKEEKADGIRRFLITVSFEQETEQAIISAVSTIKKYQRETIQEAKERHKEWWHNYYPASFAHFPDKKFESFYWMQQYKLACLTRSDKNIIDLMGPWTDRTPWPAIWWNLNIQLTYSPLFTANRLELSEPVWRTLNEQVSSLAANVPNKEWQKDAIAIGRSSSYDLSSPLRMDLAEENQYEVGNLTWLLYYYWQYCIYKNDIAELADRFYPLLRKSIAYYSHIIYKGNDGKYHLPLTASPEYKAAEDCNYDLSILRWGLETLLSINKDFKMNDDRAAHWRDILTNLTPYPENEKEGFLIGRDVHLTSSHRHYSHLLMIYPLRLITPNNLTDRERIIRSMNHWIGQKGALQGYSYTGSSSISSLLGNGDDAYRYLKDLLDKYIQPNTLYRESGPVVETPLSAATSMQEMYLQSSGNLLHIFPAVPGAWKNASFIDFRAEKGILVSALRQKGKTAFVQLKTPVDTDCHIRTDFGTKDIHAYSIADNIKETKKLKTTNGIIEINLTSGETVIITTSTYKPNENIWTAPSDDSFRYGLPAKKQQ